MFLLQPVRKPVPDEDAPVGEHLAGGGHLLVHVPPLPYPLCGTAASKCLFLTPTPELTDRAKPCVRLEARAGGGAW